MGELDQAQTPEELVFQALGAASTCWESLHGTGVFDSDRAKALGDELLARLGLGPDTSIPSSTRETSFEVELTKLINAKSRENESSTPDFILANFMLRCYDAWVLCTRQRDSWWWSVDGEPVDLWELNMAGNTHDCSTHSYAAPHREQQPARSDPADPMPDPDA